jgi:membrane-associated HD superfamily phosphohydrolase
VQNNSSGKRLSLLFAHILICSQSPSCHSCTKIYWVAHTFDFQLHFATCDLPPCLQFIWSTHSSYRPSGWFHMCTILMLTLCHWKWLFLVTSDRRTKYVWKLCVLSLFRHLLASFLFPSISLSHNYILFRQGFISDQGLAIVVTIMSVNVFYVHTVNKSKGKVSFYM